MSTNGNYDVALRADPVRVAPRASATCTLRSLEARTFFPVRLVVPDVGAESLVVTGFKVLGVSQLCGLGAVPAELFASSGPKFDLEVDPVIPSDRLLIEVQNVSDAAVDFSAEVFGRYERHPRQHKVIFGLGGVLVPAGNGMLSNVQPQRAFRPSHLFMTKSTLQHFSVDGLYQMRSARVGEGRIVVEEIPDPSQRGTSPVLDLSVAWRDGALPVCLSPMGVVADGRFLTVSATNRSDQPRVFWGAAVGDLA